MIRAMGMTASIDLWKELAVRDNQNIPLTKVFVFEANDSSLKRNCVGKKFGKYTLFKFSLAKIGRFLSNIEEAPSKYRYLFDTWIEGLEGRTIISEWLSLYQDIQRVRNTDNITQNNGCKPRLYEKGISPL